MATGKCSWHYLSFPPLMALVFGVGVIADGEAVSAAEPSVKGPPTGLPPVLNVPLQRETCVSSGLVFRPPAQLNMSVPNLFCRGQSAESTSVPEGQGRNKAALDESVIRDAANTQSWEVVSPVASTGEGTVSEMPQFQELQNRCRDHPPLPDIVEGMRIDRGGAVRDVAFDLRLDHLTIRRGPDRVTVRPVDGFELYDLGRAGAKERLYALKASTYAEAEPDGGYTDHPESHTDLRVAGMGVLHLFFMPSCRYAGGVVFISRIGIVAQYYTFGRARGVFPNGDDLLRGHRFAQSISMSALESSAKPVRIDGIDDRIFFPNFRRRGIGRSVFLLKGKGGWPELKEIVDAALLGPYWWTAGDIMEQILQAKIPIAFLDDPPVFAVDIWEISVSDGEVQLARWWSPEFERTQDSRKPSSDKNIVQFRQRIPGWRPRYQQRGNE